MEINQSVPFQVDVDTGCAQLDAATHRQISDGWMNGRIDGRKDGWRMNSSSLAAVNEPQTGGQQEYKDTEFPTVMSPALTPAVPPKTVRTATSSGETSTTQGKTHLEE